MSLVRDALGVFLSKMALKRGTSWVSWVPISFLGQIQIHDRRPADCKTAATRHAKPEDVAPDLCPKGKGKGGQLTPRWPSKSWAPRVSFAPSSLTTNKTATALPSVNR